MTATTGLFASIFGPALICAAFPLIANPIISYFKNERMTFDETAKDVAVSSSIGAITGPIGSGGSAIARSTTGLAKFGIQTSTAATAGAVGSAAAKGMQVFRGQAVTAAEIKSSAKMGAGKNS